MKTTEEVLQAHLRNVYSKFGGSEKILSDNGTVKHRKLIISEKFFQIIFI